MTDEAKRRLMAAKAKKTKAILNTAAATREKTIKSILDKIFRSEDEAVTRELANVAWARRIKGGVTQSI